MWTEPYLRLGFLRGGRDRPAVDCWGLYRLIVGERLGIWLAEFSGNVEPMRIARTATREAEGGGWVAVEPGDERPMDAVLMSALVVRGREATTAPMHVGCVIEPGRMIDIEERGGVMVRTYRDTRTMKANPAVAQRVRGIYRPKALA